MIKKQLFSALWGIGIWFATMSFSAGFVENYYMAQVAAGGDPAFTGLGFLWLGITIMAGVLAFILGLCGILPGTKY